MINLYLILIVHFYAFNATIVIASDFIQIVIYHLNFDTLFKIGPRVNFRKRFTPLVPYNSQREQWKYVGKI